MTTINELIERWNTTEGRPFKGSLIDEEAYDSDPTNIGCMCAQGQALHLVGGWDVDRLRNADQKEADRETATLLNISVAHSVLLRQINDSIDGAPSIVLTDPGKVLGSEWKRVLAFWAHIYTLTEDDWKRISAALDAALDAAVDAARYAALDAARYAAVDAAGYAALDAAFDAARYAARHASNEIQGAAVMRERGQAFTFLPIFGFATPEDVPALPEGYGISGAVK